MIEKNEEDIQNLLNKGKIFYKFTKSNESQRSRFTEAFFKEYPENSVIKADGYHGLSFCDDISKLIACIGYGDTLTQIIVDKDSPYYEDIEEFLYKEPEEYVKFGEYASFTLQTGKNYSLSDPTVINELIQNANSKHLYNLFTPITGIYKPLKALYEELGFKESANFLNDLEERISKYNPFYHVNMAGCFDKLKEISAELVKDYEHKFSFEKAAKEYEEIKENVVDRRREPVKIIKNDKDYMGFANALSFYLHSNYFTNEQAKEIVKIMFAANKMENENDINTIVPRFTTHFTKKQLEDIKTFAFSKPSTNALIDYIDEIYKNGIPVKQPTLIEKINAKAKAFKMENDNYKLKYILSELDTRDFR